MSIKLNKIVLIFLLLLFLLVFPATSGVYNISVEEKGTTFIKWNWSGAYNISEISIDGYKVWGFDNYNNSNSFILSDLEPNSTHQIKIYPSTLNQSGYNITTTLDIKETESSIFFNKINGYIFLIFVIIFLIIGASIPFVSFGAIIFSMFGLLNSVGNSFLMGLLFFILLIAAIIELRF